MAPALTALELASLGAAAPPRNSFLSWVGCGAGIQESVVRDWSTKPPISLLRGCCQCSRSLAPCLCELRLAELWEQAEWERAGSPDVLTGEGSVQSQLTTSHPTAPPAPRNSFVSTQDAKPGLS